MGKQRRNRAEEQRREDFRRALGLEEQQSDRDLVFYVRGWNAAIEMAVVILGDVARIKEGDRHGLGVS